MSNSSVISRIVEKKKDEESTPKGWIKSMIVIEYAKSDASIESSLSHYSAQEVKGLLSDVVSDKSLSKTTRKYVVSRVLRNQPHPVNLFEEFYGWNRDSWLRPVWLPTLAFLFAAVFGALAAMAAQVSNAENHVQVFVVVGLVAFLVFLALLKFTKLTFVVPELVYKNRLTNGIETAAESEQREARERAERKQELEDELAQLA